MSKEVGMSRYPMDAQTRKKMGLRIWERGEVFRLGKTRRDPGPDMGGNTKARRRLAARQAAHETTFGDKRDDVRRPGSLNKPWPAGKGRKH